MSILYLTNKYYKLEKKYNTIIVSDKNNNTVSIPIEKINRIIVYGKKAISSQLICELLEKNISMVLFSKYGNFLGILDSQKKVNIKLHKKQFILNNSKDFYLNISKNFIISKIKNSRVLLHKYNNENHIDFVSRSIKELDSYIDKIKHADNREAILGYEGNCAKLYFKCLNHFLPKEFNFSNRNKRPPKDPFNSLLSFGYTLLFYEIYNILLEKGLNPYIGFLHKLRNNHPALVSDLMEEFRSPIIDSIIIRSLRKQIFTAEDFEFSKKTSGVYLKRSSVKKFITIFENKMYKKNKRDFRNILLLQSISLLEAIEKEDFHLYKPFIMR
ncbi:CRISPR-associated endonuclease Cas1 [Brachyspira intermedia]|uniref:CRISPR-associated endonuclease Cas1 n=1 Tax=Brachyspira intermedia TaxID=84377 RepID=UPI003005F5D6